MDTSAPQNRDPTNWLCRREFFRFRFRQKIFWSRINEVTRGGERKWDRYFTSLPWNKCFFDLHNVDIEIILKMRGGAAW